MKYSEFTRAKEILTNYYQNTRMPVWLYDRNMQLHFTNFTSGVMLHLMDAITPMATAYDSEAVYMDYMKLSGNDHEVYLCFRLPLDKKHPETVVIGPGLLSYPSDEIWEDLSFHKYVWSNRKEETMRQIPVMTLESFLLNSRFIMQILGIHHLNPLQIADTLPMTDYYYKEPEDLGDLTGGVRSDLYSVKQAHEIENELAYQIQKGNADIVDEILIQRDRVSLLLPAQSHKDNAIYGIALLSIGRNASIRGGMKPESAYALFRSYSIQLQSCHQSLEFYRLIHNALVAYAEGVAALSVQLLDSFSPAVQSCIRLIHTYLPGRVTVDQLADEIHLTPKYLSALFVRETGTSLTQFIGKARIEAAQHMLATTDLSYLEIGNVLEFSSQSHFTAAFKKATGMTPRKYRLENQF